MKTWIGAVLLLGMPAAAQIGGGPLNGGGGGGGGAVSSVNGQTGAVNLGAAQVGAIPNDGTTQIPAAQIPTLNQNTTGSAGSVTGSVPGSQITGTLPIAVVPTLNQNTTGTAAGLSQPLALAQTPSLPTSKLIKSPFTVAHHYGTSLCAGYLLPFGSGTSVTDSYCNLVSSRLGLTASNYAVTGEQAADFFGAQIYPSAKGNLELYASGASPLFTYDGVTNDANVKGTGAYEALFNASDQANKAWLGLPASSKITAGSSAIAVTGGFTNTANATYYGSIFSTAAGTATYTLTTTGAPIYIWYYGSDGAATGSTFTYAVDGGAASAARSVQSNAAFGINIATQLGGTAGIFLIRVPGIAAGSHTITINTTSGNVAILGVGSAPPANVPGNATILALDFPNMNASLCPTCASAATQTAYNNDVLANNALLASDGIDIRTVTTRGTMLATVNEMQTDGLHGNLVASDEEAQAVLATYRQQPSAGTVSALKLNLPLLQYTASGTPTSNPTNLFSYNSTSGLFFDFINTANTANSYATQRICSGDSSHCGGLFALGSNFSAVAEFNPNSITYAAPSAMTNGLAFATESAAAPHRWYADGAFRMYMHDGLCVGCTVDPGAGLAQGNSFTSTGNSPNLIANSVTLDYSGGGRIISKGANTTTIAPVILAAASSNASLYSAATWNGTTFQLPASSSFNAPTFAATTNVRTVSGGSVIWTSSASDPTAAQNAGLSLYAPSGVPSGGIMVDSGTKGDGLGGLLAGAFVETVGTFSGNVPSIQLNRGFFRTVLTANTTLSIAANNLPDGARVSFMICQDATGGRTFTWPAPFKGAMVVGSNPNTCSLQEFRNSTLSGYAFLYAVTPGVINQ